MTKIQGISDDANQLFTLFLPDGSSLTLTLQFISLQTGWFCGITYGDFSVTVLRVTTSYNILAQFANLIPFGLACFTNQGQEPLFQQDFTAGNAALYLTDGTDLDALEAFLGSKV